MLLRDAPAAEQLLLMEFGLEVDRVGRNNQDGLRYLRVTLIVNGERVASDYFNEVNTTTVEACKMLLTDWLKED